MLRPGDCLEHAERREPDEQLVDDDPAAMAVPSRHALQLAMRALVQRRAVHDQVVGLRVDRIGRRAVAGIDERIAAPPQRLRFADSCFHRPPQIGRTALWEDVWRYGEMSVVGGY